MKINDFLLVNYFFELNTSFIKIWDGSVRYFVDHPASSNQSKDIFSGGW